MLTSSRQSPLLFLNPLDDGAFRAHVDDLMGPSIREANELERLLRGDYPQAVVRPRDLASERLPVWYVYRDGHWISGTGD